MRGKTTTERNSKQITGRIVDNVKKNCQIINDHFYFQVQDDAWNDRTMSEDHLIKKLNKKADAEGEDEDNRPKSSMNGEVVEVKTDRGPAIILLKSKSKIQRGTAADKLKRLRSILNKYQPSNDRMVSEGQLVMKLSKESNARRELEDNRPKSFVTGEVVEVKADKGTAVLVLKDKGNLQRKASSYRPKAKRLSSLLRHCQQLLTKYRNTIDN